MTAPPPSKVMDGMSPRELLELWTRMGLIVIEVNASAPSRCQAKGPRGVKRRSKRLRIRARTRRLQRNTWRSHYELLKKEAQA